MSERWRTAAEDPELDAVCACGDNAPSWSEPYGRPKRGCTACLAEIIARHAEPLERELSAMRVYAGILSLEVEDTLGIAIAHGFQGWPSHKDLGDRLRDEFGFDSDTLKQEAKAALLLKGGSAA